MDEFIPTILNRLFRMFLNRESTNNDEMGTTFSKKKLAIKKNAYNI